MTSMWIAHSLLRTIFEYKLSKLHIQQKPTKMKCKKKMNARKRQREGAAKMCWVWTVTETHKCFKGYKRFYLQYWFAEEETNTQQNATHSVDLVRVSTVVVVLFLGITMSNSSNVTQQQQISESATKMVTKTAIYSRTAWAQWLI